MDRHHRQYVHHHPLNRHLSTQQHHHHHQLRSYNHHPANLEVPNSEQLLSQRPSIASTLAESELSTTMLADNETTAAVMKPINRRLLMDRNDPKDWVCYNRSMFACVYNLAVAFFFQDRLSEKSYASSEENVAFRQFLPESFTVLEVNQQ